MKIRESGMPEEGVWESFFKPEEILRILGLDDSVRDVVEFGCGYGTFTIPAARMVKGKVYAIDIESTMAAIVRNKAKGCGLNPDFDQPACGRQAKSARRAAAPQQVAASGVNPTKVGLNNIHVMVRDFMSEGSGLKNESVDYVMLFNILHLENPQELLREAHRILRLGGKLGIIHWNYDSATPRGPSMNIRPQPEHCESWAKDAGFINPVRYDLKPYHYGIVLHKGIQT